MALTSEQIDTVAEIVDESYATVADKASVIEAATEAHIVEDIATWNANRDKVKLEIGGGGDGVNLKAKRLLDAITARTRRRLGLPTLVGYRGGSISAGSVY